MTCIIKFRKRKIVSIGNSTQRVRYLLHKLSPKRDYLISRSFIGDWIVCPGSQED